MALHVQTTDDIDENCIYVNHSFLFILGDIEDRSELDVKNQHSREGHKAQGVISSANPPIISVS